jgi:isopentenyldiphosphate isomerase
MAIHFRGVEANRQTPGMGERFDIYTPDGTPIGIKDRVDVHRDGDWHRSVHIWIVRPSERAVLIQKRSEDKDTWPGYWDASVGGHLSAGESYEDAYREVEEELGVPVELDRLVPLGVLAIDLQPPDQPEVTDRELCLVALAPDERPLDAYPFNTAELTAIASLPIDGLRAVLDGRPATITRWDGSQAEQTELRPGELIPQPYLTSLADAAARLCDYPEEPPKTAMKAL